MIPNNSYLIDMLVRHEGLELKLYYDQVGIPTIGCGRNLKDVGITTAEAYYLLWNDIVRCQLQIAQAYSWFQSLSPVRQDVVTDMVFNIGIGGFSEFKEMIAALASGDFETAAYQMTNSSWARQVGSRATELSQMMRLNAYAS